MINLFSKLPNENYFIPLTGKNKQVYLNCLEVIFNKSKFGSYLKEDDAKDYINALLRKTPIVEESDEKMIESYDAAGLIRYLRSYGWIKEAEIGTNYEKIIKLSPEAVELIICFSNIANNSQTITATNDVISVYSMIVNSDKIQEFDDQPYSFVLKPVLNSMESLFLAIITIDAKVKNAATNVKTEETINNVLDFMCRGKEELFPDYYKLKNNGNIDAYISKIKDSIMSWNNNGKLEKAIIDYAQVEKVTASEATKSIKEILNNIYIFFNDKYPAFMNQLDKKTEDYFNSILARLRFLSNGSGERRLENVKNFLNHIKDNRDSVDISVITASNIIEFKYLSSTSAKKRLLQRKDETRQVSEKADTNEELLDKIKQDVNGKMMESSLKEKAEAFIEKHINGKSVLTQNDMPLPNNEDYYLYNALFCVYGGNDRNKKYTIVKTDGTTVAGTVECDNFELRKKAENEDSRF